LEVDAPNPGWVEIADTWYPGWQVTVDGSNETLYKADGLFRAVAVGEGKHLIEIKYRPPGFYFAGLFSILIPVILGMIQTRLGRKSN
jgi:uncharacterized membrane protein YfhO